MTYRIGEFARLAGVTPKTLRFYEECGILRPERIDARTRYRYYSPQQLRDLAMARAFRAAGVPLSQIKRLMSGSLSDEQQRAMLVRLQGDLHASLQQTARSLQWIAAMLAAKSECAAAPVLIKHRPEVFVASMRAEVDDYEEMQRLERELVSRIPLTTRRAFRAVLWHRCAAEGRPEGEPVVEIARRASAHPGYASRSLPATTVASAYSSQDDADAERAYAQLHEWTRSSGYDSQGPKCEIAHADVLEIQFPIVCAAAVPATHRVAR